MVLYYTGTGNSRYVAERIAEQIGDSCEDLFDKIRANNYTAVHSDTPYIFASPTYCWQLPHILRDWISNTDFDGSKKAYFVLTCGDGIGNAGKFAARLCEKKGFEYMGCTKVVMPENYIAMFDAPDEKGAREIIEKAEASIAEAADLIKGESPLPLKKVTAFERIASGPAFNNAFYKIFVRSDKFYATDECIGCGKCVTVCPLKNVELKDGKPKWNGECTHCMACICHCPKEAIEYGNKSKGKPRYKCPI